MRAIAAILILTALGGCNILNRGEACLPKGEQAKVLRKGSDGGQRFVTLKRTNGEEITCLGDNTPQFLQEGDMIDASTLTRARATKSN